MILFNFAHSLQHFLSMHSLDRYWRINGMSLFHLLPVTDRRLVGHTEHLLNPSGDELYRDNISKLPSTILY
jgi:hypothetical protein